MTSWINGIALIVAGLFLTGGLNRLARRRCYGDTITNIKTGEVVRYGMKASTGFRSKKQSEK